MLDYNYILKYYKMIAADLSKQQTLDPDPKAIQQINFTWNVEKQSTYFNYWRSERNSFRFFSKNCKSILILFLTLIENDST